MAGMPLYVLLFLVTAVSCRPNQGEDGDDFGALKEVTIFTNTFVAYFEVVF